MATTGAGTTSSQPNGKQLNQPVDNAVSTVQSQSVAPKPALKAAVKRIETACSMQTRSSVRARPANADEDDAASNAEQQSTFPVDILTETQLGNSSNGQSS